MQLTILFTTLLATLATSLPTELDQAQPKTLSTRQDYAGDAYLNNEIRGRLYVNGGCSGLVLPANQASINPSIRCRYFREGACVNLIGGTVGLQGTGRIQKIDDTYRSATCWWV